MKRVAIVNLGGTAYHVEEDGIAAIEGWLETARTRLAADPDRDELLADFEQAIADKCDVHVTGDRTVIDAEQVAGVLATLGTVEAAPADPADGASEPATTTSIPRSDAPWRERKLYRLTSPDEGKLAGVCAGLAAYLNMDVTVVRVLTVILTVATSGAAIIVYVAMALLVPEANTSERRAAVFGYGETAQEMMSRARDGAGPALATLGSAITRVLTVAMRVARWTMLSITWLLLTAWLVAVVWIVSDGDGLLSAFDPGTSRWIVALWVTCGAWIVVSVALGLVALCSWLTPGRRRRRRYGTAIGAGWIASIGLAVLGLFAIPASHSEQVGDLGHGTTRIELFGETICITDEYRDGTDPTRCGPDDHLLD